MNIPQYRLTELSESWFQSNREEFAAMLASGETLVAYGKPVLKFSDVAKFIYAYEDNDFTEALFQLITNPEHGTADIKKVLEKAAQELVDAFEYGFRASYEQEINEKEAA